MRHTQIKNLLFFLLALLLVSCTSKQDVKDAKSFEPNWESVSKFPKSPEFFLDAKFGIYTHWGPVTVATDHPDSEGGVQWYGMHMYHPGNKAFDYHRDRFGDQNEFGYKDVTKLFRGEKFDAEEWAKIFARSGARFAGPVAIHHDNYAMWDSEVTAWNSMDQSPGKDFTGELASAIKAEGMLFMTAFHHAFTWDYFIPAYNYDAGDGSNADLYCEVHDKLDPPSKNFLDNWLAMINEVIRNYEPDMIWYDFGLGKLIPDAYQLRMFADYYNWAAANEKNAVVFHKHEKIQRYTGVLDFERGRTNKKTAFPWLTDTSLGPWFHDPSHPYYSSDQLVDILVDIISKNGCMLLNVGPAADGSIPDEARTLLYEIGDWLAINGEGVFETRPWKVFGEGPTRLEKGGGFNEKKAFKYSSGDIRFTSSKDGKILYAFLLDQPKNRKVEIKSLNSQNGITEGSINRVQVLGLKQDAGFNLSEQGLMVNLPEGEFCTQAICLKIHLQ